MDDKQKNLLKLYNTTGNLTKEVVCDRDGIFNGEYKSYYYNGKLKNVVEYVKGDQEGKMISYFSNGKVNTDYNYEAGEMDGRYKRFFFQWNIGRRRRIYQWQETRFLVHL